jgi:hypothetical protein
LLHCTAEIRHIKEAIVNDEKDTKAPEGDAAPTDDTEGHFRPHIPAVPGDEKGEGFRPHIPATPDGGDES